MISQKRQEKPNFNILKTDFYNKNGIILWTNYVQNIKIQPMQIHCRQAQPPKFVHGPNGIAARQLSANGPLTRYIKERSKNDGRTKGS